MTKKIEIGKQYRTRSGHNVRILCVDRFGDYPVVALIDNISLLAFTKTGQYHKSEQSTEYDLIEYNPAQDLKLDQAIWVKDCNDTEWYPRHFKGVSSNGNVECWTEGRTSHTAGKEYDDFMQWKCWSATNPNK